MQQQHIQVRWEGVPVLVTLFTGKDDQPVARVNCPVCTQPFRQSLPTPESTLVMLGIDLGAHFDSAHTAKIKPEMFG